MGIQVLQLLQSVPGNVLALLPSSGSPVLVSVAGVPGVPSTPAPLQGNIFIDPANVSGVASDGNPGTNALPLKSWAGLMAIWGTYAPLLTQATTITFLSSHTDNTDPVIFYPFIGRGVQVLLRGTVLTVTGGALAGTVAKNRTAGANSLLQETLIGTSAAAHRIVNTSRANSVAWTYRSLGANAFELTQPLAAAVLGTVSPAENDLWANADGFSENTLTNVNIVNITPTILDGLGFCALQLMNVFDPAGVGGSICNLDSTTGRIDCYEVAFQRIVAGTNPLLGLNFINCLFQGGLINTGFCNLIGGASLQTSLLFTLAALGQNFSSLDGDFILGCSGNATFSSPTNAQLGFVFLDTNVQALSGNLQLITGAYGGHVVYGRAAKNFLMQWTSRLENNSGTFVAALTAPGVLTGVSLNGATNAISHTNAQPDVLNGNVTTSAANLDAAAGAAGFGGNAYRWAGASIANAA